jgi:hypothetical protein
VRGVIFLARAKGKNYTGTPPVPKAANAIATPEEFISGRSKEYRSGVRKAKIPLTLSL